jgi:heptosyltransferase-1
MSSLGDIIQAFPVLQYFKQCEPECKIDWVVESPFAELVRAHPLIHQVIVIQTKKWRSQFFKRTTWREIADFKRELRKREYDLVLDLQGNIKSGVVTGRARSSLKVGFDYASVSEWPNLLATHKKYCPPSGLNIREDYLFLAKSAIGKLVQDAMPKEISLSLSIQEKKQLQSLLVEIQQRPGLKVLVCSGSNWTNKQLSQETLQSFLLYFLKQFNAHFLLIWGNPAEKVLVEGLAAVLPHHSSIINRLSLPSLQNLMTQVDLILAMDSLPLHLAGMTSTPTYSVFGASSAQKYKPMGERHHAFQGNCPFGKVFEKRCDILRTCKTGACIKQLKGHQLFEHFHVWWNSLNSTTTTHDTSCSSRYRLHS